MSTRTGKSSIDRGTAERFLRGGRGGGDHPLASLLVAAKAPGRDIEPAREEMAMTAFRAAHRGSVPRPQRRSMIKSVAAKLLTVKIATLAATVAGVGGVALAASTGTIPSPLHANSPSASHSPADKARPSDRPSEKAGKAAAVPSGFPPGLYWLCTDYIGRDADHRGKALGEAKFRELANQAGGRDPAKADKFCDKLLNDSKGGAPTTRPNGTPTTRPNGTPGAGATPPAHKPRRTAEPPANRPSGKSSTHPNR